MKNISLFLLALNLIVGLWLYTTVSQTESIVAEKQAHATNADVILTLDEVVGDTDNKPSDLPSVDSIDVAAATAPLPAASDVGAEVMVVVGEVATTGDSPSLPDMDKDPQQNLESLHQNVETRVKEVIGFVGDAIGDIAPPAPTPHCYTLGPFSTAEEADRAAQRLQEQNVNTVSSETERHRPGGYWVYIPSDSLRSARKQIDELKGRGIKDVGLSSHQGVRHWVSLGLYSTQERAQRRQRALSNIGFYTRMERRTVKTPEYWIDITLSPEQEPGSIDSAQEDTWPGLKQAFCRETGNS